MDGMGTKGEIMYHYLEDKEFQHAMKNFAGKIMQSLCHILKEDYDIGANFHLVGSGAKNLILQNARTPVDLDYNLEIIRCDDFQDCQYLKECVRKSFDKAFNSHHSLSGTCYDNIFLTCEDSTSCLTSKPMVIKPWNQILFSIDVGIVMKDNDEKYHRLIHEKTGSTYFDKYYWNIAPNSKKLQKKVDHIKNCGKWPLVRQQYRNIKNNYLVKNDSRHSQSFICYIEAVNNVYNSIKYLKKI